MRRSREIRQQLQDLQLVVDSEIRRSLNGLEITMGRVVDEIVTRFPESRFAAEEFAALRKALMASGSASTITQQSLISLANAIDEGASPETVRLKIVDLLGAQDVREIVPDEVLRAFDGSSTAVVEQVALMFAEVGESASPRSAWVRGRGSENELILQRGYVSSMGDLGTGRESERPRADVDGPDRRVQESRPASAAAGDADDEPRGTKETE